MTKIDAYTDCANLIMEIAIANNTTTQEVIDEMLSTYLNVTATKIDGGYKIPLSDNETLFVRY